MMIAYDLLAARPKGGEGVKSGPIGLAVILVLCVAAYFLFKSMSKHLKRVRENFPSDDSAAKPPGANGSAPQDSVQRDAGSPPVEVPPKSESP